MPLRLSPHGEIQEQNCAGNARCVELFVNQLAVGGLLQMDRERGFHNSG